MSQNIIVSGIFDNMRLDDYRFLNSAGAQGNLHVLLWSDEMAEQVSGTAPKFPTKERQYLVESLQAVGRVSIVHKMDSETDIPACDNLSADVWISHESDNLSVIDQFCKKADIKHQILGLDDLEDTPTENQTISPADDSAKKRVVVTGCYDWFHSGHVAFFEEVSALGDLYVVVGHDENIKLLKGEGHPMFGQDERRYIVQSIRFVKQALVSSGTGWMDAEPEIARIKPDIYAVNEDGDVPEKAEFCKSHGLTYTVLKRIPKEGLTRRESTHLRGF